MAERDFYNVNSRISYPLVTEDSKEMTPTSTLPNNCLVDAGFVIGEAAEYEAGTHSVLLYSVEVTASDVIFSFRDTTTGANLFLFTVPQTTLFGAVCYADVSAIDGDRYIVIGDLTDVIALGTGVYLLNGDCRVEPGLIESEYNTAVSSVNSANTARCCPGSCTREPSSSSSGGPEDTCDPETTYSNSSFTGDVLFEEGYNMTILLNQALNAVQFTAQVGQGAGEPCMDIRVAYAGPVQKTEWCVACDEYIQSINGQMIPDGKLVIVGGNGISIEPDLLNCLVIVRLNSEYYCEA
jgi:hypothetical protein